MCIILSVLMLYLPLATLLLTVLGECVLVSPRCTSHKPSTLPQIKSRQTSWRLLGDSNILYFCCHSSNNLWSCITLRTYNALTIHVLIVLYLGNKSAKIICKHFDFTLREKEKEEVTRERREKNVIKISDI